MLHRLLLILLIGFVPFVNAESDLPDCPVDQPWVFDNCISTFTLSDGSEYVGEVNDTGMHGQGTLTTADGYKYVGEWKGGKENGQGTLTLPDGSKYVGEWKDGKKNGQGSFAAPDFPPDQGYFMNGKYVPRICTDMGLTKGTPEHGQCVLRLMDSVMSEDDQRQMRVRRCRSFQGQT